MGIGKKSAKKIAMGKPYTKDQHRWKTIRDHHEHDSHEEDRSRFYMC